MTKKKLKILYEDKYIIIVDKPSNLLTIATTKEKEKTLYHQVYEYLKQKNKNSKIFIVHRLDKDTSGIVIFAKDMQSKIFLQSNWDKFKRNYVAIVEGKTKEHGILKNYLMETKTHLTYVVNDKKGKLAITEYEKVLENKKYTMLSINIKTGRKNQIRVQLSTMGNPIVGDKKYGTKQDPIKRMALVANTLEFIHPKTNKKITIDIDIPKSIINLFK